MWTNEQQLAIGARADSLIVSASAGSGKTAVLVERVLQRVCDPERPCDIDRFLIVTFTKAAAAEIREKINAKLRDLLAAQPENLRLQHQLILVNRARISTVDSFCMEVVRQNFHLLNLPPSFRIASDKGELAVIRERVLEDLIEEGYQREDEEFLLLVEQFCKSRGDKRLSEILLGIFEKTRAYASLSHWAEQRLADLENAPGKPVFDTPWGAAIRSTLVEKTKYLLLLNAQGLRMIEESGEVWAKYHAPFQTDREQLEKLLEAEERGTYCDVCQALQQVEFARLPILKNSGDYEEIKARAQNQRDKLKKLHKELCALCARPEEGIWEEYRRLYPLVRALFSLTLEFADRFQREKQRRGLCDFTDLELYALRVLAEQFDPDTGEVAPSAAARELGSQFEEIFVDEYQDTNQLQDLIFRALSASARLFLVGDVKQSIYRFRLAVPEIFLEKSRTFPPYGEGQAGGLGRVVLPHNFRSTREVTGLVNFVFRQLMSEQLGDTGYLGNEELLCGAAYSQGSGGAELALISCTQEDTLTPAEYEARYLVRRIRQLLDGGELIEERGGRRPVRCGDIAVLLLYPSKNSLTIAQTLREAGIPASCEATQEFLTSYEVSTVLSFLKVIDNPNQDIHLVAALKSPMFCFTPDMLAQVRMAGDGSLYHALRERAREDEACAAFLETLERYRLLSSTTPVHGLLWKLYFETGFYSSVSALPGGRDRQENLRLLYGYAKDFEQTSFKGLFSFNVYIGELLSRREDFESAAGGAGGDSVKIMSIHKSKGLEFPVCFLAGLSQRFNSADARQPVVLHSRLGLGFKWRDTELLADYDTFLRRAVLFESEREQLSELVRVLYVAMTRPKQYLFLSAASDDLEDMLRRAGVAQSGGEVLGDGALSGANCFLHWLLPCLARHPDAEVLREAAELPKMPVLATDSRLSVSILESGELGETLWQAPPEEEPAVQADPVLGELLRKNLSMRYPYDYLSRIPSKVTVTELSHERREGLQQHFSQSFKRPVFITRDGRLNAAERGTALHAFFQYSNLFSIRDAGDVEREKERLREYAFLTGAQLETIVPEEVLRFCESEVAGLVRTASWYEREHSFNVVLPAGRLMEVEGVEQPQVLLQGVIDCIACRDDRLLILDYKTDRVQQPEILVERYREQLELYAKAAEEIYGLPVAQKVIYSLHLGVSMPL